MSRKYDPEEDGNWFLSVEAAMRSMAYHGKIRSVQGIARPYGWGVELPASFAWLARYPDSTLTNAPVRRVYGMSEHQFKNAVHAMFNERFPYYRSSIPFPATDVSIGDSMAAARKYYNSNGFQTRVYNVREHTMPGFHIDRNEKLENALVDLDDSISSYINRIGYSWWPSLSKQLDDAMNAPMLYPDRPFTRAGMELFDRFNARGPYLIYVPRGAERFARVAGAGFQFHYCPYLVEGSFVALPSVSRAAILVPRDHFQPYCYFVNDGSRARVTMWWRGCVAVDRPLHFLRGVYDHDRTLEALERSGNI